MAPLGQQHYPSQLLRRHGRNRDRGLGDPQDNGRHYPYSSGGRCSGPHDTLGGDDDDHTDDHYGGSSDSSSSSEFGR